MESYAVEVLRIFLRGEGVIVMFLYLLSETVLCFLSNVINFGRCAFPGQRFAEELV